MKDQGSKLVRESWIREPQSGPISQKESSPISNYCMTVFLLAVIGYHMACYHSPVTLSPTDPQAISRVELLDREITESSGLARSLRYDDCFWTHNDSGDSARLFLVDLKGETQSVIQLDVSKPIDWEDMASFRWKDEPYLAVGDIGGNARSRSFVNVYLFPEPELELNGKPKKKEIKVPYTLEITFDGGVTNFESLAVDPSTDSLVLVEKGALGGRVYSVPLPSKKGKHRIQATVIGEVPIALTTSCDISSDGHKLAIISYSTLYLFERIEVDGKWTSWTEALKKPSLRIQLPKLTQAEAVCFSAGDDRVFLTSEQRPTPLVEFGLRKSVGK